MLNRHYRIVLCGFPSIVNPLLRTEYISSSWQKLNVGKDFLELNFLSFVSVVWQQYWAAEAPGGKEEEEGGSGALVNEQGCSGAPGDKTWGSGAPVDEEGGLGAPGVEDGGSGAPGVEDGGSGAPGDEEKGSWAPGVQEEGSCREHNSPLI